MEFPKKFMNSWNQLLIHFQVKEKNNHIFQMAAVIKLLNQKLFNKNLQIPLSKQILQFKRRKRILVRKEFPKKFMNLWNQLLIHFQVKEKKNHIFQMEQVKRLLNQLLSNKNLQMPLFKQILLCKQRKRILVRKEFPKKFMNL